MKCKGEKEVIIAECPEWMPHCDRPLIEDFSLNVVTILQTGHALACPYFADEESDIGWTFLSM